MTTSADPALNSSLDTINPSAFIGSNTSPYNDTFTTSFIVNQTKAATPPNATALYGLFGVLLLERTPPMWMRIVAGIISVIVFVLGAVGNLTVLVGFAANKHGKIRHIRNVNIFVLTVFDLLLSTAVCVQQALKYVACVYLCTYVYFTAWQNAIAFLWFGSCLTSSVFAYSNFLQISLNNVAYRAHETSQRTWLRIIIIGIALPLTIYGVGFVTGVVNYKSDNKTVFNLSNDRCVGEGILKRPFSTTFWAIIFMLIPLSIMLIYLLKTYRRMRAQRIQQQPVIVYAGEIHIHPQYRQGSQGNGIANGATPADGTGNEPKQAQEHQRKRRVVHLTAWVVLTATLSLLMYIAMQLVLLAFAAGFLRNGLVWYFRLYEGVFLVCQLKSALDPFYYMMILPEFHQMALEFWQPALHMLDRAVKFCAITNNAQHSVHTGDSVALSGTESASNVSSKKTRNQTGKHQQNHAKTAHFR